MSPLSPFSASLRARGSELSRPADGPRDPDPVPPAQRLLQAVSETVAHLAGGSEALDATTWADVLQSRLAGPELDLGNLDPALEKILLALPDEGWKALDDRAREQFGTGIDSLVLGPGLSAGRPLATGLGQLTQLRCVTVSAPSHGTLIDFSPLRGRALQEVRFAGEAPRGLVFNVPAGVLVEAVGDSPPSPWTAAVYYTNDQGEIEGAARPLGGQIHDRRAVDFRRPGDTHKDDPQLRAPEVRLNLKAEFNTVDAQSGAVEGDVVMCRRITAWWLDSRIAHRDAAQGEDKRYSYAQLSSLDGVAAIARTDVDEELERMVRQGSCGAFAPVSFGRHLARFLSKMPPGDCRRFAVSTGGHLLGLELMVKQVSHGGVPQCEYVVHLYDPTFTAKHASMSAIRLDAIAARSLAGWIGDDGIASYFTAHDYSIGSVFAWPPDGERGPEATPMLDVPPEQMASRHFMHAALNDVHPRWVAMGVRAIAGEAHLMDRAERVDRLLARAGPAHTPGLFMAIDTDSPGPVIEAYVRELMDFPQRWLPSAGRLECLRADYRGRSALLCAMQKGRVEVVQALVRAVLSAPDALTRGDRYRFLLSEDAEGRTLLGRLCSQAADPAAGGAGTGARDAAIRAYLQEVLDSPVLSGAEKESLVTAGDPPAAALAQAAGNPGAAAAMQDAVARSSVTPALRARLLAALGLSPSVPAQGGGAT